MLQELEDRIDQTLSEMDKIDKELKETSQKEEMSRVKELIEESKRLTSRKQGLKKNIEQLQRSQDLLREGYFEAVQEQSMASINKPEDKILLSSLKEKTQSFEKDLENKTKSLKNLKEELNRTNRGLDEIRHSVYRQSMKSAAGVQIQNAWVKKELLEKKLESLKKKLEELKKQYTKEMSELAASAEAIDLAKTVDSEREWQAEEETIPLLDLLIRIAVVLILLILTFLLYWIIAFFTPYLREKSKFKGASLKGEFNLAIILLYNFLSRVLNLFGYKYPVVIDPEEHLITIGRRFENLQNDSFRITNLFLEARYSTHKMIREQVEKALNSYGNILTELKSTGSFWQKLILKLNFVFKI